MNKLLKHGIFVLLSALLVTAFIVSCPSIGEVDGVGEEDNSSYGVVRVVVAGASLGRTVIPDVDGGDFKSFKLEFTAESGHAFDLGVTTVTKDYNGTSSGLAGQSYSLVPGVYSLVVTAYMALSQSSPAAGATVAAVTITEKNTTNLPITLTALIAGSNGTFSWNIDWSGLTGGASGLTTADMTVKNSGGTTAYTTSIKDTPISSTSLAAGIYTIAFALNNGYDAVSFTEVLYIYQNMESKLVLDFINDAFFSSVPATVTVKDVQYNDENDFTLGFTTPNYGSRTVGSGTSVSVLTPPNNALPVPSKQGWQFMGWWTDLFRPR